MIFVAISSIRIQIIYDMYVECALLLRSVHTLVLIQMRTLQNVTPRFVLHGNAVHSPLNTFRALRCHSRILNGRL